MTLPTDPYNFTNNTTADAEQVDARFAALFAALAAGGLDVEVLASQAWTAFTPTVSDTSVTLGSGGTNVGRYAKLGRTVHAYGRITLGTGGLFTGASDIKIALPVTAADTNSLGSAYAYDTSAVARAIGVVIPLTTATLGVRLSSAVANVSPQPLTATFPWTWAVNDFLHWAITYEAAS